MSGMCQCVTSDLGEELYHLSRAKQKGGLGIIFGIFFFHAKVMSTYPTSIMEILVPIWNVYVP